MEKLFYVIRMIKLLVFGLEVLCSRVRTEGAEEQQLNTNRILVGLINSDLVASR